ncbi:MAG: hypothetical protein ACI81R_000694 [Bradymonadia bacterium]|jgi:hypothetical protein
MGFVERARSAHDRGDVNAAVVTLASGLRRRPDHEDAVDWFLDLYLEEVQNTGLERELLRVLEQRADGYNRYESLVAELEHLERFDKVDALEIALERTDIKLRRASAPQVLMATPAAPLSEGTPKPAGERWDEFQSPIEDRGSKTLASPPHQALKKSPPTGEDLISSANGSESSIASTSASVEAFTGSFLDDVEQDVAFAAPGPASSSNSIPLEAWPEDLPTGDVAPERSPWAWAIVAAVFAAILATALFALRQAGEPEPAPQPTPERPAGLEG